MSDMNVGTIGASIRLDLSQLAGDASKAESTIQNMTVKITQNIRQSFAGVEKDVTKSIEAQTAAIGKLGSAMSLVGGTIVGALAGGVKAGADFEAMLNHVSNNTNLTASDVGKLRETVIKLGTESGASFQQLAEGFMHITNFGFTAAQAPILLREAMKAAVATGGDVGKTGELLANIMHEYSIQTNNASRAMNTLQLASQLGNTTLEQFVEGGGKAFAMSANLGTGFVETAAAMAALTRHGFSMAESATQVRNILMHLVEPGQAVRKALEDIGHAAGVNLIQMFTASAVSGRGMSDTLNAVKDAAVKAGFNVSEVMLKVINAMRGGLGAMVLAKTGAQDYSDILGKLSDTYSGKVDVVTKNYQRTLGTLDQQVKTAKNNLLLMADDIEKALAPAVGDAAKFIGNLARTWQGLTDEEKDSRIKMAAFVGGMVLAVGGTITLIGKLVELRNTLIALGEIPLLAKLLGGAGLAVGGIAAVGGFGLWSMKKTLVDDEEAALKNRHSFWNKMTDEEKDGAGRLAKVQNDIASEKMALMPGNSALSDPAVRKMHQDRLNELQQELAEAQGYQRLAAAGAAFQKPGTLPGMGTGGAGGDKNLHDYMAQQAAAEKEAKKREREANAAAKRERNQDAKDAKADAEQAQQTNAQVANDIASMTLSPFGQKLRRADQELAEVREDAKTNPAINVQAAIKRHALEYAQAKKELQEENNKRAVDMLEFADEMDKTKTEFDKRRDKAQAQLGPDTSDFGAPEAEKRRASRFQQIAEDETAAKLKEQAVRDQRDIDEITEILDQETQAKEKLREKIKSFQSPTDFAAQRADVQSQFGLNSAVDPNLALQIRTAQLKAIDEAEQEYNRKRADENQQAVDEQNHQQDRVIEHEYAVRRLSYDDYVRYLQDKIAAGTATVDEQMRLEDKLSEAQKAHQREAEEVQKQHAEAMKRTADTIAGVFEPAFRDAFTQGPKKFFDDILQGFEKLIIDMIAKWAASGIASLFVSGGSAPKKSGPNGDILGLITAIASAIGFDDPINDGAAKRWGFDFASQFSRGVSTAMNVDHAGAGGRMGGNVSNAVSVNFDTVHVHNGMDVKAIGEAVAWHAQMSLQARVGS